VPCVDFGPGALLIDGAALSIYRLPNHQVVEMSVQSARMQQYVPLIIEFAGRIITLQSAMADSLGLHATDLRAVRLVEAEPMTAGALGQGLGLTGAATTAVVDRLEKAGYVVRERGTLDRRKVAIRAVPEKVREVDLAYAGLRAKMADVLSTYSAAEFSTVVDFIEKSTQVLVAETAEIASQTAPSAALGRRRSAQRVAVEGPEAVVGVRHAGEEIIRDENRAAKRLA
jgi:DNA-binding MarR family transcriptional regulator